MINIDNYASKFKPCKRKGYESYVCKIPAGSCILNPVVNYRAINLLKGRMHLTPKEVMQIQRSNPEVWNLIRGCITSPTDFILFTNGVLERVSFSDLSKNYTYADGTYITRESILLKSYICEMQFGVLTPINMTYSRAFDKKRGTSQELEQVLVMKWVKVTSASILEEVALPVVDEVKTALQGYLPQTMGVHFIVGTIYNGELLKSSLHFIDNKTFSYVYDCRAWSRYYINNQVAMKKPEELFVLGSSINNKQSFADVMVDYIKSKYIDSIAYQFSVFKDLDVKKVNDCCVSIEYNQSYENAGIIAFIFQRGTDYCFTIEYKDYFDEVYKGDIKEHLKHLDKHKFVLIKEKDFQTFKSLIHGFLNLENSSVVSSYFSPRLTNNEYMSLKMYSGSEFGEINSYLRGEKVDDAFKAYIRAIFIADIIDRSIVGRDIYHFRGLSLKKDLVKQLKEGYVLENNNFVSSSITTPVALSFAASYESDDTGVIIVFKNTARQHGMYLNSISAHRNSEFEVLFNANYDLVFVKQLGDYSEDGQTSAPVWLCDIKYSANRGIKKYAYKKDATEKLITVIQQDKNLMKNFYISSVSDEDEASGRNLYVELSRYNTDDVHIRIDMIDGKCKVEFFGLFEENTEFSIKEMGYNYIFKYIYKVLSEHKEIKNDIDKSALSSFSERFMYDLTSLFVSNNFIVTNQDVNKNIEFEFTDSIFGDGGVFCFDVPGFSDNHFDKLSDDGAKEEENDKKREVVTSEFTVVGNDLQTITFEINISKTEDTKIKATLGVLDKETMKEFIVDFDKRLTLFERVYKYIVGKFELDPTRRLKRVFSIIGGFEEEYVNLIKSEQSLYKCFLGNRVFEITMQGSQVTVELDGKSVSFGYFDSIYDSASEIYTIM